MTTTGARAVRVAAVALCVTVPLAMAGETSHRVQSGESASSVAKNFYGDYDLGELLLLFNDKQGTVIQVGERLRVPYCDVHTVRAGDSWSALSLKYLGDSKLFPAVAELNGLAPQKALQVGQRVVMPVVLPYELGRGESLAVLSERFYGDSDFAGLLQEFNRIGDPRRLAVGETVRIPLVTPTLKAGGPVERTATRPAPPKAKPVARSTAAASGPPVTAPKPTEPRATPATTKGTGPTATKTRPADDFSGKFRAAETAFHRGAYDEARDSLEALVAPVIDRGSAAERAELSRLLAFVYVAFDRPRDACAVFGDLEAAPPSNLDPTEVSPKIRAVLSRCPAT